MRSEQLFRLPRFHPRSLRRLFSTGADRQRGVIVVGGYLYASFVGRDTLEADIGVARALYSRNAYRSLSITNELCLGIKINI